MRYLKLLGLSLTIFVSAVLSQACDKPTVKELSSFFNGRTVWKEVEFNRSKRTASYELAARNPITLNLNFKYPSKTTARWGRQSLKGANVMICRESSKVIVIRQGGKKLKFVKLSNSLISSQIPMVATYYYRPANLVKQPTLRTSANDSERTNNSAM